MHILIGGNIHVPDHFLETARQLKYCCLVPQGTVTMFPGLPENNVTANDKSAVGQRIALAKFPPLFLLLGEWDKFVQ